MHWKGKRSIPCDGYPECLECRRKAPQLWKGYAPVDEWDPRAKLWVPWVLEVTSNLEELLRGRDLRGEVWTLFRRTRKGKTDPVDGVWSETLPEHKLRAAFDVVPVLLRVYNVQALRLDVANVIAPKLMLEALAGDAPELPAELLPQQTPQEDQARRQSLREMMNELRGNKQPPRPAGDQADDQAGKNGSSNHGNNGR